MITTKYKIGLTLLSSTLLANSALAQCLNNENSQYVCSGNDASIQLTPDDLNDKNSVNLYLNDNYVIDFYPNYDDPYPYDYAIDYSGADFTLQSGDNIALNGGGIYIDTASHSDSHVTVDLNGHINTVRDGYNSYWKDSGIEMSLGERANVLVNYTGDITTVEYDENGLSLSTGFGIYVRGLSNSAIALNVDAHLNTFMSGIKVRVDNDNAITINSKGSITATPEDHLYTSGIVVHSGDNNTITVNNQSAINARAYGIDIHGYNNSTIKVTNQGQISSGSGMNITSGDNSTLDIVNSGEINAHLASGIYVAVRDNSNLNLEHSGKINAANIDGAWGGKGVTIDGGNNSHVYFLLSGEIIAGSYDDEGQYHAGEAISVDNNQGETTIALANGWQVDGSVDVNAQHGDPRIPNATLALTGQQDSAFELTRLRDDTDGDLERDGFYGFGHLVKNGRGTWTLTGQQTQGAFQSATVDSGELLLNNAALLLAQDSAMTINAAGTLAVMGHSTVEGNLVNHGTVANRHQDNQFTTLTIAGDYRGEAGSAIQLNGQLGGDGSAIDKLLINGNASGTSAVTVKNIGGLGAQTIEGIEIITVAGQSDAAFTQSERIVAGAYDYHLFKKESNWYLTSSLSPAAPPETGNGNDNENNNGGNQPDGPLVLRPEAGSYIDNIAAANSLFNLRLYDRAGETQYVDALTGEVGTTSMWMRTVGGHNTWQGGGSSQLSTSSNRYAVQLGGNLIQGSSNGVDKWQVGLMAGHGVSKSKTAASLSGYHSRGKVAGYSAGLYGTWYGDGAHNQGLYLDSWLQYNWFTNDVNGDELATESYHAKGLTASIETGYAFLVNDFITPAGNVNHWYIQPQAQAIFMGVKSRDHREGNGTVVSSKGAGNILTRLGVKTYLSGNLDNNDRSRSNMQPFAELNWLHHTRDFSVSMDGARSHQGGAKNQGEARLGLNSAVTPDFNVWGAVGLTYGGRHYQDSLFTVGAKYQF